MGTKGFLSPKGTSFAARSLPVGNENNSFNTYRVEKSFNVFSGKAAAAYGQPGGGTQYFTGNMNVQQLLDEGYLEQVN